MNSMAPLNRTRDALLSLLLLALAASLSSASSRHLSPAGTDGVSTATLSRARELQPTTAGGGAGGTGSSEVLAKEGEQCNSGGSIAPIACEPGLTCNLTSPLPTPAVPGWNPDSTSIGTCVKSTNASEALAEEGEACTTGVGCRDGLYCAAASSTAPSGATQSPEGAETGTCREAPAQGELCFASGTVAPPDSSTSSAQAAAPTAELSWSVPCGKGLTCFILDPSPTINSSLPIQSKLASLDANTRFLGYCTNQSDVPQVDSRQGSGTAAGVCQVKVLLPKTESPCQEGLTCVVPTLLLQDATPGAVVYGVCADPKALVPQTEILSPGGDNTQESAAEPKSSSSGPPTSSVAGSPKRASEALHRHLPQVLLTVLLSLVV